MLPNYIYAPWQVFTWLGLATASSSAAITLVRPAMRSANLAVIVGWLTAMGWIAVCSWSALAYQSELTNRDSTTLRLAAALKQQRQIETAAWAVAAVLTLVLASYARMRFAESLPLRLRSRHKLAMQYHRKLVRNPPRIPGLRNDDT